MDQAIEASNHQLAKLEQQVQSTNDPDQLIAWITVSKHAPFFSLMIDFYINKNVDIVSKEIFKKLHHAIFVSILKIVHVFQKNVEDIGSESFSSILGRSICSKVFDCLSNLTLYLLNKYVYYSNMLNR